MSPEATLFELDDATIDAIVFAMEDQDCKRVVDLESGKVLALEEAGDLQDSAPPPSWSSREGYRLMEEFVRTIRSPGARHDLAAALNRGRGVFKAFKAALAAYPEVERAFHDHKAKVMRSVIRSWYDELREAKGLERLGSEPEDNEDLIEGELGIRIAAAAEARDLLFDLCQAATDEALELLPEVLAEYEGALLEEAFEAEDWIGAWIDDGEGGAIAGAAARRIHGEGRSLGSVFFVYVNPEFRRSGFGRSLVSALVSSFRSEGTDLILLDSAFLPREFSISLEASGLMPYGTRGFFRS